MLVDIDIVYGVVRIIGKDQGAVCPKTVIADPGQDSVSLVIVAHQIPGVCLLVECVRDITVPYVSSVFLQKAQLEVNRITNRLFARFKLYL